jgi:hypothetical protein
MPLTGRLAIRLTAEFRFVIRRYVRIHQRSRAGRTRDRIVGPLPQTPQRFCVAKRDSGLQACALRHLGQIHDRIDQTRPAARADMPRRRVQRCLNGSVGFLRSCHLGSGDRLITIFDFDVPGRVGIGHGMPPGKIAVACRNNHTGPNPPSPVAQPSRPGTQQRRCRRPCYCPAQPAPGMKQARRIAKCQVGDGDSRHAPARTSRGEATATQRERDSGP